MSNKKREVLVIIPARGGSKRLLKKNSLSLLGKPLLEYSIDFAKSNMDIVDKIIVSTDDDEIKDIALKNNIEVIDRPHEFASDTATTVSVLKHVLENSGAFYDNVILLQPTNPCRPKDLLKNAFYKFLKEDFDSLMTVTRNQDKLGRIVNNSFLPFNYKIGQRSQDLEPLYLENGLLYIIKTKLILENKILGEKNLPYIINHPYSSVDIDTIDDFKFAEFILSNYPNE